MSGWNHEAMRIGDRERRQVLKSLAKHHARGRIDDAELAERTDAVHTARTFGDLQVIFADLGWRPQRSFAYDGWQGHARMRRHRGPFPLLPLLVVVAIVLAATGTIPWLAVAIGAGVLLLLGALAPRRRRGWGGPGWAC